MSHVRGAISRAVWLITAYVLAAVPATVVCYRQVQYGALHFGRARAETREALGNLKECLSAYASYYGSLPKGPLPEVLQLLEQYVGGAGSDSCLLCKGLDGWQNPIHYIRVSRTKAVLYSNGPNRLDDGGDGDDIIVLVGFLAPAVDDHPAPGANDNQCPPPPPPQQSGNACTRASNR